MQKFQQLLKVKKTKYRVDSSTCELLVICSHLIGFDFSYSTIERKYLHRYASMEIDVARLVR
jgi:hypothetical protein